MALAGRDSKVHWSVKESTLRSIFTPSREALIRTLKPLWRSAVSFIVFVYQDTVYTQSHKVFSNKYLFAPTTTLLQICGNPVVTLVHGVRLCRALLIFLFFFLFRHRIEPFWSNVVYDSCLFERIWSSSHDNTQDARSIYHCGATMCVCRAALLLLYIIVFALCQYKSANISMYCMTLYWYHMHNIHRCYMMPLYVS